MSSSNFMNTLKEKCLFTRALYDHVDLSVTKYLFTVNAFYRCCLHLAKNQMIRDLVLQLSMWTATPTVILLGYSDICLKAHLGLLVSDGQPICFSCSDSNLSSSLRHRLASDITAMHRLNDLCDASQSWIR